MADSSPYETTEEYIKELKAEIQEYRNILGIHQFITDEARTLDTVLKDVNWSKGCQCRPGDGDCASCIKEAKARMNRYGITALLREVARLTNRIARVEASRDSIREDAEWGQSIRELSSMNRTAVRACETWIRRAWEAQRKARKYRSKVAELAAKEGET